MKLQKIWTISFIIILISFTAFVMLDTFIIPRSYMKVEISNESTAENESLNESAEITVTTYREYDTTIYVADVKFSNVSEIQAAFANDTYGRNIKAVTSSIAEHNDAILAINGDFYGARDAGYVIRNGVLYRDDSSGSDQEDLVIYKDGSMECIREGDISAKELLQNGAWHVFSFGPALLSHGQTMVDKDDEVEQSMVDNPRTAIGIIDNNHYIILVADGRTDESVGLKLYQLAAFMKKLGVVTAYNLDGGGSSTMYYQGKVINNPTTNGDEIKERRVSDIVFIR